MADEIINTFTVAVIIPDFIDRFLLTLQRYTPPNYKVIVVDNSREGVWDVVKGRVTCYLRPTYNLGFAKSQNIAIAMSTTKYVTCANDDVEFINANWWPGVMAAFAKHDERVIAVNPDSVKVPGWGYGVKGFYHVLPYKPEYTSEDYDFLLAGEFSSVRDLPPTYPQQKRGVIDGITTWCTVFDTERMGRSLLEEQQKFGITNPRNNYFDEKFYPGGGEDYDLNARMYRLGKRMISTSTSWVYHHWSSSRDYQGLRPLLREDLVWNNLDELWPREMNEGQGISIFGHRRTGSGEAIPLWRVAHVTTDSL